jgi:hypothetical protein
LAFFLAFFFVFFLALVVFDRGRLALFDLLRAVRLLEVAIGEVK